MKILEKYFRRVKRDSPENLDQHAGGERRDDGGEQGVQQGTGTEEEDHEPGNEKLGDNEDDACDRPED